MVIDPVTMPEAYRQSLLAALGTDDPAEVMAGSPDAFRSLIEDAGPLLHVRPEPGEWSVAECLAHLTDGEVILTGRYRWIVAEDEPDIVGYDQALWVSELDQNADDPASLLAVFTALRRWNLDLWSRRPEEDRERVGIHRERGPESYGLTFRLGAGHDRIHFAQARRALEAVRAAASTG